MCSHWTLSWGSVIASSICMKWQRISAIEYQRWITLIKIGYSSTKYARAQWISGQLVVSVLIQRMRNSIHYAAKSIKQINHYDEFFPINLIRSFVDQYWNSGNVVCCVRLWLLGAYKCMQAHSSLYICVLCGWVCKTAVVASRDWYLLLDMEADTYFFTKRNKYYDKKYIFLTFCLLLIVI